MGTEAGTGTKAGRGTKTGRGMKTGRGTKTGRGMEVGRGTEAGARFRDRRLRQPTTERDGTIEEKRLKTTTRHSEQYV
jgi:hypothetical protein